MGWRMKNFNVFGVHGKIWVLVVGEGGVHEKTIYREGDCLKRGPWTVWRFKGGLARRGDSVFDGKMGGGGAWYPNAHYDARFQLYAVNMVNIISQLQFSFF